MEFSKENIRLNIGSVITLSAILYDFKACNFRISTSSNPGELLFPMCVSRCQNPGFQHVGRRSHTTDFWNLSTLIVN